MVCDFPVPGGPSSTKLRRSRAAADGAVLREVAGERWRAARAELTERTESLQRNASELLNAFEPTVITIPLEPVRQALREAGCDVGQGFLVARPLTFATLTQWLHRRRLLADLTEFERRALVG